MTRSGYFEPGFGVSRARIIEGGFFGPSKDDPESGRPDGIDDIVAMMNMPVSPSLPVEWPKRDR